MGRAFLFILVTAIVWMPLPVAGQSCEWEWVHPAPPGQGLNQIAWGNGILVGVGNNGLIVTSDDGTRWHVQHSGTSANLNSVIHADGRFVAIGGDDRDGVVLTSIDGESWQEVFSCGLSLQDISWGDGRFIVVEGHWYLEPASVLISLDGVNWTQHPTGQSRLRETIVWNGSQFFAGDGSFFRSNDGINWTKAGNLPDAKDSFSRKLLEPRQNDMVWDGASYIFTYWNKLYTSLDGDTWTLRLELTASGFSSLGIGPGVIVAAEATTDSGPGFCSATYFDFYSSVDGGVTWSWSPGDSGDTDSWVNGITWADSQFVAVSSAGDVVISEDGRLWYRNFPEVDAIIDVTSGPAGLVAVGYIPEPCPWAKSLQSYQRGTIARSADGSDWSIHSIQPGLKVIRSNALEYMALAGTRSVAVSDNGRNWVFRWNIFTESVRALTWGGDRWMAFLWKFLAEEGSVVTSTDGLVWTEHPPCGIRLSELSFYEDRFVGLSGRDKAIALSSDGSSWTVSSLEFAPTGFAASDSRWVVVGGGGDVVLSDDQGVSWTNPVDITSGYLVDITYDGELFVAVGQRRSGDGYYLTDAMVLISPDGEQWTKYLPTGGALNRVISTDVGLIAVGDDRTIIRLACSPLLAHLSPAQNTVSEEETFSLTLTLSQAATASMVIDVASSEPETLALPDTVTIPAGRSQVTFDVTALSAAEAIEVSASLPAEAGSAIAVAGVNVMAQQQVPRVPTLGTWAIAVLILMLGTIGIFRLRKSA